MSEHDIESEKAQELQNRADNIFYKSLKSIEPATIKDAINWAYRNDDKALGELAGTVRHDEFYAGSLLNEIVQKYLREESLKEAERG